MSAHVVIDDQLVSLNREMMDSISAMVAEKFKVMHVTIQIECQRCELGTVCGLPGAVRHSQ